MPNFKSVVHFLQVDFGEGILVSCDRGKTKSTPSQKDCRTEMEFEKSKSNFIGNF